jgi:hypothetical protein
MTMTREMATGWRRPAAVRLGGFVAAVAVLAGAAARAAEPAAPAPPPAEVARLASELVGLFVVATVMESALTTLFNWRLYLEFFNGRAVKTLVMFGFGWAVVTTFDYDVFHRILVSLGASGETGPLSRSLSALVLSGGSVTVYQLFKMLGLRPPAEPAAAVAKPPADKAWISVRVVRSRAVGDVAILVEAVTNPTPEMLAAVPLAGIVRDRSFGQRLRAVFLAEPLRWPPSGGHAVPIDTVHRVAVRATLRNEGDGGATTTVERTLHLGRFAGGAVLDFVETL